MEWAEWVGGGAAFLTTTAFFPQLLKVLKDRNTASISLGMYAMFSAGVVLWLTYGLLIGSWPIIVGNTVTLACNITILLMKIRHG